MASKGNRKSSSRPDIATLGGLLLAAGGILGGLTLEGGKLTDIAQVTALMIVLGGTLGAVMVTTPLKTLLRAAKSLGDVFLERIESPEQVIEEIIALCHQGAQEQHHFAGKRLGEHRGPVSPQGHLAQCGRHRSAGAAQNDGAGPLARSSAAAKRPPKSTRPPAAMLPPSESLARCWA